MALFSVTSLRGRLLTFLLSAAAPVGFVILYLNWQWSREVTENLYKEAQLLASLVAASEQQLIQQTQELLFGLSNVPATRNGDSHACNTELARLWQQRKPTYANIGVVRPNGEIFCSAAPLRELTVLPHSALEKCFKRVLETHEFAIGEYAVGQITQRPVLVAAHPVLDNTRQLQSVVFAALDLQWLNQLATAVQIPAGASLTILDRNGTVLARHPDLENWIGRSVAQLPLFQSVVLGGATEATGLNGEPLIYAYASLVTSQRPGDVNVVVGMPKQVVTTIFSRLLMSSLLVVGVIALTTLAVAWVGSERLVLQPLQRLAGMTRRLTKGELRLRVDFPDRRDELAQLARSFDEMVKILQRKEEERDRAEQALHLAHQQLLEAQEHERRRLAYELHDEIGQMLTAVKMNLQTLQRMPDKFAARMEDSVALVESALAQVRALSLDLRPPMLDELGLIPTLQWYVQQQARRAGWQMHFVADPLTSRPPCEIEAACFRVAQEALTNVARHANAFTVWVEVRHEERELWLSVRDDGRAFNAAQLPTWTSAGTSLGLIGMQERVRLVGGKVTIASTPEQGTEVRAWFPLVNENA